MTQGDMDYYGIIKKNSKTLSSCLNGVLLTTVCLWLVVILHYLIAHKNEENFSYGRIGQNRPRVGSNNYEFC